MKKLFVLLVALCLSSTIFAKDLTFGEIQRLLLDKEVIISAGHVSSDSNFANRLSDWKWYEQDSIVGYRKELDFRKFVPATLRGSRARVVQIDTVKAVPKTDAFGKPVDASAVKNPYIELIVQLDGTDQFIGTTGYYITITRGSLTLVEELERAHQFAAPKLKSLVGKTLYNNADTRLLDGSIGRSDILSYSKRTTAVDRGVANLTKMTVSEFAFIDEQNAVILKVVLPDGTSRILYGDFSYYAARGSDFTDLERLGINAYERIPSKFTAKEVAAIKEKTIFQGMSEDALFWSWGSPEKTNNYGQGGMQYVYGAGQYVYVTGKRVRDFQTLR